MTAESLEPPLLRPVLLFVRFLIRYLKLLLHTRIGYPLVTIDDPSGEASALAAVPLDEEGPSDTPTKPHGL